MHNLIRAEFYRYKEGLMPKLVLIISFLCGIIYGLDVIFNDMFEDIFIVPLFILQAIFISMEIGQEYSDGTIRNKIITGHSRAKIYVSKLITSVIITLIMTTLFLIPAVILSAIVLINKLQLKSLLFFLLVFYLLEIVWAALFNLVSQLISKREISAIINFALIIIIYLGAYQIETMLGQPETYHQANEYISVEMTPEEVSEARNGAFAGSYSILTEDDGTVTYYKDVLSDASEESKNPRYIDEPWRTVLSAVDSILPQGQINLYMGYLSEINYNAEIGLNVEIDNNEYSAICTYPIYSLVTTIVLSAIGIVTFRKKEFK